MDRVSGSFDLLGVSGLPGDVERSRNSKTLDTRSKFRACARRPSSRSISWSIFDIGLGFAKEEAYNLAFVPLPNTLPRPSGTPATTGAKPPTAHIVPTLTYITAVSIPSPKNFR